MSITNQEQLTFVDEQSDLTTDQIVCMAQLAEKYKADTIIIGGVEFIRIPDPDRKRKLQPPDAPIVTYCNSKYYLLNSAKLQSVRDLTLIVGINPSTGKKLLEESQNKMENENE